MMSPPPASAPAPSHAVSTVELLSRFIVFLESKETPADPLEFIRSAQAQAQNPVDDILLLNAQVKRQPEFELQSSSFSTSVVLSVMFIQLASSAPLINNLHYDYLVLLQRIKDTPMRHAALRKHIATLDLVVGDLLSLIGRWCQKYQLDEVCTLFVPLILHPRDLASPYVAQDPPFLPIVLREMVLSWCAEDQERLPLSTMVTTSVQ